MRLVADERTDWWQTSALIGFMSAPSWWQTKVYECGILVCHECAILVYACAILVYELMRAASWSAIHPPYTLPAYTHAYLPISTRMNDLNAAYDVRRMT